MRRVFGIAVALVLLVLLLASQSPLPTAAVTEGSVTHLVVTPAQSDQNGTGSSGAGTDYFTLYVNQFGFNDSSGDTNMTVSQGASVTIAFIWNDSLVPYNAHQLRVEGYNVTSAEISQYSPISVVNFTAGMAGSFRIHCIIPCLGMSNMQNGWLIVTPVTTASTTTTSTSSTLSTSSTTTSTTSLTTATSTSKTVTNTTLNVLSISAQNGVLLVSVALVNSNGSPVVGVPVQFSLQTDFGKLPIGSNKTQSDGSTSLTYQLPSVWEGPLYVSFSGTQTYAASYATVNVSPSVTTSSGPPYVSGQVNFPDLRLVGIPPLSAEVMVGIFLTILACLYLVIVFVLVRVGGIGRRLKVDK